MATSTPQMSFFRRPLLASQNMKRLAYATVRGSVRRLDPDAISVSPYFPVSAAQTLIVDTQTSTAVSTSFVVNSSLVAALAALNTNLAAANAKAVEQDGCISIQSLIQGSGGWVRVTGGTAATTLGFDVASGIDLFSRGGDLDSAPQGRLGNTFGTAFPGLKDDLSATGLQRSLGRLASNMDVLWSEVSRRAAARTTAPYLSTADASGNLPMTGTAFYNGIGVGLTRTSPVEQIAPYFVLQDSVTLALMPNDVTAVGVGTTSTVALDATNITDTGKNLLGQNIILWGPSAIGAGGIKNGQVINVTGIGSTALVGDVVGISGSTNTTPWSNEGIRWVVEQVLDANNVAVRPMSSAEFAQFNGAVPNEGQPILELNPALSGTQIYGNATVYTGAFYRSACTLLVSPALAPGRTVNIWYFEPRSMRTSKVGDLASEERPLHMVQAPFRSRSDTIIPLAARRNSNSAGPIFQAQTETGAALLSIKADGSIGAPAGAALVLNANDTPFWTISTSGDLTAAGAAVVGTAGGNLTLKAGTAGSMILQTNSVTRWTVGTSGSLTAAAAATISTTTGTLSLTANGASSDVAVSAGRKLTFTSAVGLCWTMDASGNLVNGSTGTLQMNAQKITGVADCISLQDAATKNYVDKHWGYAGWKSSAASFAVTVSPTQISDANGFSGSIAIAGGAGISAASPAPSYFVPDASYFLVSLSLSFTANVAGIYRFLIQGGVGGTYCCEARVEVLTTGKVYTASASVVVLSGTSDSFTAYCIAPASATLVVPAFQYTVNRLG